MCNKTLTSLQKPAQHMKKHDCYQFSLKTINKQIIIVSKLIRIVDCLEFSEKEFKRKQ